MVKGTILSCIVLMGGVLAAIPAKADAGKQLFDKQCAGCHTIGGGDSGGPDLMGVATLRPAGWLARVIAEPDKLTAEKDPVQLGLVKKYGYEMPNLGINAADAQILVAYLKAASPGEASAGALPAAGEPAKTSGPVSTPELIRQGQALFTGVRAFAKGGAPCGACHALSYPGVTGGTLAADLTSLYEGVGDQGMKGMLNSLKFPIMKKIYADRPLTEEEISALIVFARDAAARKGETGSSFFAAGGAGVFLICIVGLTLYKRRIG